MGEPIGLSYRVRRASATLLTALLAGAATFAHPATLVINANTTDPVPRAAWESAVRWFQRENPGIDVEFNVYDHESYKKSLKNWLTAAPPDIVFWFAGNRMRQLAAPGLLDDLTDLFTPAVTATLHPSAVELVTSGSRQYGVPYTEYQVGFYYRRDVLTNAGIPTAPRTWPELVAACDTLKRAGVEPFAIGTKDLWPAAAWFDYIDLRLNGIAFHRDLMEGRVRYTDPRVAAVFARWRELVERGCFSRNHAGSSWQESQALLYNGRAAMMLIGNYIVSNFPADIRPQMSFAAFPSIRDDVGRFEDAPMNTIHVPAGARNKSDARRFAAFVLRADVQEALNRAMLQIPVNLKAPVAEDRFLTAGRELLGRADGLMQFFDRDTSEDLANIAMKGFQEFMLHPERIDAILADIERARRRIYGPLAQ